MDVLVVDHPLAKTRLTALRDERTDAGAFRAALHELTTMLVYEAARATRVHEYPITTPVGPTVGYRVAHPPLLVPVLRAGLGMSDAALALLPESSTGFRRSGIPIGRTGTVRGSGVNSPCDGRIRRQRNSSGYFVEVRPAGD